MPFDARIAVLPQEPGPLEIIGVPLPDPGPHEVVVEQFASGVCHSQLHQMHNPRPTAVVLGHESTGTVVGVGSEVDHVMVGDRVFVTWVPRDASSTDRAPASAKVALPDGRVAESNNVYTWADVVCVDEQYVVKVPIDTETHSTAIIGCAVMTGAGAVMNTAEVRAGQSVVIIGVGGVGLSAVVAASEIGASPIIAVDLDDEKLRFARSFGATETVNASNVDPIAAIHELTSNREGRDFFGKAVSGCDFAFDCIGHKVTMEQIVPMVRTGRYGVERGGTAVLVGVPQTNVELNARDMLLNEKRFIGSLGGSCVPDRDFPVFLDWHKRGVLDLDALVTERFALDDLNEATRALEHGEITGRSILDLR